MANAMAEITMRQKVLSGYALNLLRSLLYHYPDSITNFMVIPFLFFFNIVLVFSKLLTQKLLIMYLILNLNHEKHNQSIV
jgi:hypothetical protein